MHPPTQVDGITVETMPRLTMYKMFLVSSKSVEGSLTPTLLKYQIPVFMPWKSSRQRHHLCSEQHQHTDNDYDSR